MSSVVEEALHYIESQYQRGLAFTEPAQVASYFSCRIGLLPYEVFVCAYLDTRNQLISCEEIFRGTVNSCSVHPREIVRQALMLNATHCVVAHNHPSGLPDPSPSDTRLTNRLRDALALMDIVLLDHFIIGGRKYVSFRERGLM